MIDGLLSQNDSSSLRTHILPKQKWQSAFALLISKAAYIPGDITPFESLAVSLATSLGTGSIIGVAMAIAAGGPGAVFWMLLTAFLGTATKYAEGLLAIKYRTVNARGEISGGPMYYIEQGLHEQFGGSWIWLGWFFASLGVVSSLCLGNMLQANTVIQSVEASTLYSPDIIGALLTAVMGLIILGGIHSISKVISKVIPTLFFIYTLCCLMILFKEIMIIPSTLALILRSAFTAKAVGGGLVGTVIRFGVVRGVLVNQAGFGISSVAHAASKNEDPVMQGMINTIGSLFGSMVICLLTAIVILVSGIINFDSVTGQMIITGIERGPALITAVFHRMIPGLGGPMVTTMLLSFSMMTMLSWYYYGSKCLEYMFGVQSYNWYKWVWISLCFSGTYIQTGVLWNISDIFLGLMAIPNLIALLALTPLIFAMTKDYEQVQDKLSA